MKKMTLLAAAAALTLSACAATGPTPTHTANDAKGAISAAEHETARAKKNNYAWRDTGKMIKKAKEAMKKEDYDTAVKLANKAKRQSTLALQQFEDQKQATGPIE